MLVAGETKSQGFELDLNGKVSESFRVSVAAALLKAWTSEGDPGGYLVVGSEFGGVPRRTLNVFGIYSFGAKRALEVGGGFYYASPAWADAANTFRLPSVTQIDAVMAYRFSPRARIQVNVRNVTNSHNYTSNGYASINPGEPVSVFANLRVDY